MENRVVVSEIESDGFSASAGIAEVGIAKKERASNEEADTLKIWSMADCMRYAAEHSYAVRKQMYETNSYKADRDRAIASFFPSLSAGIGGTMNWGRSIDPNTNTYTTQQSFANNYDLSASMPLFAGGQYVKQWMLAASNLKMGQNDIARLKDEAAMNAMQAFVDVVYYRETVRLSEQNLEDSRRNLYKTEQEEALGLKGKADVAQFRSQVATADYQLTSQQNLYNTSLLTLKQVMNFPLDKPLVLDSVFPYLDLAPVLDNPDLLFEAARETNPQALQARYQFRAAQLSYKMSIGAMMPSISVSGGLNTSYIGGLRDVNNRLMRFDDQFKNNWGGYVSVSMSIPIFSGLYSYGFAQGQERHDDSPGEPGRGFAAAARCGDAGHHGLQRLCQGGGADEGQGGERFDFLPADLAQVRGRLDEPARCADQREYALAVEGGLLAADSAVFDEVADGGLLSGSASLLNSTSASCPF